MKILNTYARIVLSSSMILSPLAKAQMTQPQQQPFRSESVLYINTYAQEQREAEAHRDFVEDQDGSGAYVSAGIGNGSANHGGEMEWRTLEVRFGTQLNRGALGPGSETRLDVFHYNEGHPNNNHRDGFGFQVVLQKAVTDRLKAEVGVGPYYSMNTTTLNGVEYDDKELGILATAALLYYFNNSGTHVRVAYNRAVMPSGKNSDAFIIGLGQDFDGRGAERSQNPDGQKAMWVSVMAGTAKTNHGGTEGAEGGAVEVGENFSDNIAGSLQADHEGDDESRVNRNGIAAQMWVVQPLNEKWTMSGGIGPYLANNNRGDDGTTLNGLISVRIERSITNPKNGLKLFVDFSRVVSSDNNDRDLARIGLKKVLK